MTAYYAYSTLAGFEDRTGFHLTAEDALAAFPREIDVRGRLILSTDRPLGTDVDALDADEIRQIPLEVAKVSIGPVECALAHKLAGVGKSSPALGMTASMSATAPAR